MRPKFNQVWKEIGVDDGWWFIRQSTITVPWHDVSLMLLHNAGNHRLKYDPNLLKVVTGSVSLNEYLMQFGLTGRRWQELSSSLVARILSGLSAGGKLLAVTGRAPGPAKIEAGGESQNVYVVLPMEYTVSFKFLRNLVANGRMVPATSREPEEVEGWIGDLNWIFGAQANVWFKAKDAKWIEVKQHLGQPIGRPALLNYLARERDDSADITVFLVGKWQSDRTSEQGGSHFPDLGVIVLDDHPNRPEVKGDPFTIVLAHELVHFVLGDRGQRENHHDRNGILFSELIESTRIDSPLQHSLNP